MARQRDYRAEYQARKARAAERGLTLAQATGHAKRAGQRPISSIPGADRRRRPGGGAGRGRPLSDITAGGRRLVRTGNQAVARQTIRDAAGSGDRVKVRGTYQRPDGTWRTGTLSGGGAVAQAVEQAALLGRDGARQPSSGSRPGSVGGSSSIEITVGSDGLDPGDLYAFLDLYDSVWDALDDLWDLELYG